MRPPVSGDSKTRAVRIVLLLQVGYLLLVALLPLDYFLREQLFLVGGFVGGLAGGLLLGPLPVGHDRPLQFGSVLYGGVRAATIGTLGFHAVRFAYVLVAHWGGYAILQRGISGTYAMSLRRSALVVYVVVGLGRYALAAVLTAAVGAALGYAAGDVVHRRFDTSGRGTDDG